MVLFDDVAKSMINTVYKNKDHNVIYAMIWKNQTKFENYEFISVLIVMIIANFSCSYSFAIIHDYYIVA